MSLISRVATPLAAAALITPLLAIANPVAANAATDCLASSFTASVPTPAGPPTLATATDSDGAQTVVYAQVGANKKTYTAGLDVTDLSAKEVTPLYCLAGAAWDVPSIAVGADYTTYFVRSANTKAIYERTVTDTSTGAWKIINGPVTPRSPAATVTPDGQIHLFYLGSNGALYHKHKAGPTGAWSATEALGGVLTSPASVAVRTDGKISLVAHGTKAIYVKTGNTGAWGPWTSLGGNTVSYPTIASGYLANRLDVFVPGTNGGLFQKTFNGTAWTTSWRKIELESDFPASVRIAATGLTNRIVLYGEYQGETIYEAFDGATWQGWWYAPYTCGAACLPTAESATASSAGSTKAGTQFSPTTKTRSRVVDATVDATVLGD